MVRLENTCNCLSTALNRKKHYLATLTSSFTDFNFDSVVLEICHESQIPVTTGQFEPHTV